MCGSFCADWNWRAMLSRPNASSPKPWMKMMAEDSEGPLGGIAGGMIMGGVLSGGIVYSLKNGSDTMR